MESKYKLIDVYKSLADREKNKRTRNNLKAKCSQLRTKIVNTINDFQWKSANFLCSNYKYILFPDFGSKKIKKNLNKTQRRRIDTLSHYKFRMKMEHMCKEYQSKLIIVSEAYTSKTCGGCGKHRDTPKKRSEYDWYACDSCEFECDRDVNGARNILVKYASETENKMKKVEHI